MIKVKISYNSEPEFKRFLANMHDQNRVISISKVYLNAENLWRTCYLELEPELIQ